MTCLHAPESEPWPFSQQAVTMKLSVPQLPRLCKRVGVLLYYHLFYC